MNINELADNYIAVWNETDADMRKALIANTFAGDATYVDPLASVEGHEGIHALVGAVQERFPGFRFRLDGKVDGYANRLRFSWTLGPDGIEAPIRGTDVADIRDGRLANVIGFLDRVPVAA